ncbi:uncharacterized protein LOC119111847 [Pollicipes pollicipes]|uniref:uncharacterized protein LOC119111847 n=1 Tax=Pollicipes pollicipes TaxID=41117 RepID=UPI0018849A7F|nr:uncharacterized protein LOC119111847 [Pollicipes pollicipes]
MKGSRAHSMPDTAQIALGPVCALPVEPMAGAEQNFITANFVFQHVAHFGPDNTFSEVLAPNPFYFNVFVESEEGQSIFASSLQYPTSNSKSGLNTIPSGAPKKAWLQIRTPTPVRPGQTVLVDLCFKMTPGSMSDHQWHITAPDEDNQIKLCDVRVSHVGANYVCHQDAAYRRLIHYKSYDSPTADYATQEKSERGVHTMITYLTRYANAGLDSTSFYDDEMVDADTVVTSVAMVMPESAASFRIRLVEGSSNTIFDETTQVPVTNAEAAAPAQRPPSLTFTVDSADGWSVYPGVMKKLVVMLDMEEYFERTVKLLLEPAESEAKYDACCAYVTFVGENSPCVNTFGLESVISKSSPSLLGPDVLTFDMGRLCSVPLIPRHNTSNLVNITVGLRPRNQLAAGETFSVGVSVVMDDTVGAFGRLAGDTSATIDEAVTTEIMTVGADADLAAAADNGSSYYTTGSWESSSEAVVSAAEPDTSHPPVIVTFTVASEEFTGASTPGEMSMIKFMSSDDELITMTETSWLKFNISLPLSGVGVASLKWSGFTEDGRAAIVPTGNIRVLARGRNVPCFGITDLNDTIVVSTTLSNTQYDVVSLDLGYVTNTGMTASRETVQDWVETDDMVQFEAEFRFTDHPRATHQTLLPVNFEAKYGTLTMATTQEIMLKRLGTEVPDMELTAWTVNDTPYQRFWQVPVDVVLRHKQTSTADAVNATVSMALPPFIAFESITWTNFSTEPTVVQRRHALDLSWPLVLTTQEVHVSLMLTVDPNNLRGFGAGYSSATTPITLKATMFRRYGVPGTPTGMYPPEGVTWYTVAPPTYITFDVNSEECFFRLGLTSGVIQDCQLSASSAADDGRGPQQARMQPCAADDTAAQGQMTQNNTWPDAGEDDKLPCAGTAGWSPEQRSAPFRHWHQVDFGNLTRITGVLVARPPGTRRVNRFRLQESLTGVVFEDVTPVTTLNWAGDLYSDGVAVHKLTTAVETRYVRFLIESAEAGDDQYIGVQLEYLGCQMASDFLLRASCDAQPDTPLGTDPSRNRHFAVDTTNGYIYFCDFIQARGRRVCFVSYDTVQWRRLPEVIESVRGFDETTGRIYVSGSRAGTVLWSSDAAATWFTESEAELEAAAQSEGFFAAQDVPALTPEHAGFTGRAIGEWVAGFDGLSLAGQLKVKWSAVDCSG